MQNRMNFTRREALRAGGGAGLAGLGVAAGLGALSSPTHTADSATLPSISLIEPQGNLTMVEDQLFKARGYFTQFGVNPSVINVADGSKILAALISGNADMCPGSGFSGIFPAVQRGAKIKILAGAAVSSPLVLFSKRPDVKSVKDLVGRTVGVGAPGALLHQLTVALLDKKGIDYHKVTFVNIGSSAAAFKAVAAGTVDAGPGDVEYVTLAKQYGVHPLSDGAFVKELPLYTGQAMYATDEAIAAKRQAIVRVLAAYARLFRFMSSADSKEAMLEASKATLGSKVRPDAVEAQWEFFQHPGSLATDLVLSDERINYVQQLNVKLGVQKKVLPISEVADMSLARDALKLLTS